MGEAYLASSRALDDWSCLVGQRGGCRGVAGSYTYSHSRGRAARQRAETPRALPRQAGDMQHRFLQIYPTSCDLR